MTPSFATVLARVEPAPGSNILHILHIVTIAKTLRSSIIGRSATIISVRAIAGRAIAEEPGVS